MAREIQSLLNGLAQLRIDETSEDQLKKLIPNTVQRDWNVEGVQHRLFTVKISNESDPRFLSLVLNASDWLGEFAYWSGYRYIDFDAYLLVEDGKVSKISYGLATQPVQPKFAGSTGYTVSARSAHSFWIGGHHWPMRVSSQDDLSPQYRLSGDRDGLYVNYAYDAPRQLTDRIFQLNLRCLWALSPCTDAREIAPAIWNDIENLRHDTYQQIISSSCPDSIVEGRMRYIPDVPVALLEVTGSRRIKVSEEGTPTEDWFTDYRLIEQIRGENQFESWKNIRFRRTIPSVREPGREMANQIYPPTKIGSRMLFFGDGFYSCRFIPATASALKMVRESPVAPKRPEDEIPTGLQ